MRLFSCQLISMAKSCCIRWLVCLEHRKLLTRFCLASAGINCYTGHPKPYDDVPVASLPPVRSVKMVLDLTFRFVRCISFALITNMSELLNYVFCYTVQEICCHRCFLSEIVVICKAEIIVPYFSHSIFLKSYTMFCAIFSISKKIISMFLRIRSWGLK